MTPSERLSALAEGRDPLLVMRLKSGFAVMSHTQFLRGYCLPLAARVCLYQLLNVIGMCRLRRCDTWVGKPL